MKGDQRAIVSCVLLAALALAFYMLVLSPKRSEVSELDSEISSLESSISQQEQVIAFGKQARKDYPRDYGRLVVLGKAVPEQADTASLLVELNSIAGRTDVAFRSIMLAEDAGGEGTSTAAAPAPTTPAPGTTPAEGAEGSTAATPAESTTAAAGTAGSTATTAAAPAPATEASAANLPIGTVVGTAGLPTLPYALTLRGGFFQIADYMGGIDSLVGFEDGKVHVNGRLMTVDGFTLKGGEPGSDPTLNAGLVLTSYVTPSSEGLTGGATPGGPAPATAAPQTTPASTVAP